MLRIDAGGTGRYCDGVSRRSFVQLGVAGMANLQFRVSTASGAMAVHIDDFVVDEGCRGAGGGAALIEACIKVTDDIGAASISVNASR